MRAKELLDLLAVKHSGDVFVPECKNGPTHGAAHLRMDAWAMRRSWTAPQITGYEIKVSRSDFLSDKKWPSYLPYCHYFSFVVAPGVCDPKEVPEECGLLIASKTGTRLFQKRKPIYRNVVIPDTLWMYILICRSTIRGESVRSEENREYWLDWLAKKKENREIGYRVSRSLRDQVVTQVEMVKRENESLTKRMAGYDEIAKFCDEIGVSPYGWLNKRELEEKLNERNGLPKNVKQQCDNVIKAAERLRRILLSLEPKGAGDAA